MSEKETDRGSVEADRFVRSFDDGNEKLRDAIHALRHVQPAEMWPAEWARTLNEAVTTLQRMDQILDLLSTKFGEVPEAYDIEGYVTSTDGQSATAVCNVIQVILDNARSNVMSAIATIQPAIIRADKLQFEEYVDNS